MATRSNIFVVHSWEESDSYERARLLLLAKESSLADYSIPHWQPVEGSEAQVKASIRARISWASAVIVLNTSGLHRRPYSAFEMQQASELSKRIIVLQPHGDFRQPIPAALDGAVYRVVPWRGDVLGRAVRCEYPYDDRVFDVAEKADRRRIVQILASVTGAASLLVLSKTVSAFTSLQDDLQKQGITLAVGSFSTQHIVSAALSGAFLVGGITALATRDLSSACWGAAAGAVFGACLNANTQYRAVLHGTQDLRVLTMSENQASASMNKNEGSGLLIKG